MKQLFFAATLPLIISLAVTCGGCGYSEPQPVPSAVKSDLTITPPEAVVQFNPENEQSRQRLSFHLANTGNQTLQIAEIRSSCGCAVAEEPALKELHPGTSTTLTVEIDTPALGTKQVMLSIATIHPETETAFPKIHQIPIVAHGRTGELGIQVIPQDLTINDSMPGHEVSREFRVTTHEDRELTEPWLIGFQSTNPRVTVSKITRVTEKPISQTNYRYCDYRCEVIIDNRELTETLTGWLQPVTLDNQLNSSTVLPKIFVQSQVRPCLSVSPSTLIISSNNNQAVLPKRQVRIRALDGQLFAIQRVSEQSGRLESQFDASQTAMEHVVWVTAIPSPHKEDDSQPAVQSELKIETNHPHQPDMAVAIRWEH